MEEMPEGTTIAEIESLLRFKDGERNERGNTIHRMFFPAERYVVDFASDFCDGWEQFDTSQDAPYFGVWVNRRELLTLTYCEGDWSLVVCEDVQHYNAEVQDAIDFYEEGFIAKAIDDDGKMTTYVQDRSKFLVDETPQ
jgi:hypothetical protein